MLSQDQFELMESKFFCGQLDTELFEKSKVLSPQLCCDHFRFLSDFGGTVAANAVDPNASTEHELQKAELARFKAKLGKEQSLFISFRKQLDAWEEAGLAQDAEQKDRLRKEQRNCIEKKQDQQYPVMDMPNCQAAMTFTEATVNKFIMDEEKTTCGTPLRVFWLNSSTLGYDSVSQVKLAVTELSTTLASNPQTSMMLVAMPTVGNWGNEYVESEVQEASKKILTELHEPHHRLVVREVSLFFQEATIPQQSKRPGYHRFAMAISDQTDADGLLSLFAKSQLWKRQTCQAPMQSVRQFVDPRRNFQLSGSSLSNGNDLSKPARKKQYLSGYQVFGAFLDNLLAGIGKDSTAVMLIHDVFAYDVSVAEAVMRKSAMGASSGGIPALVYVATCWADCNSRDPQRAADAKAQQNVALSNWLRVALRRKLHELATEQILKIPGWVTCLGSNETRVMPKLDEAQFTISMPTAGKTLALRQDAIDSMKLMPR